MARGLFLSLDGLDGTGKSTQCRRLAERLRGRGLSVNECADPGGTALGDAIRALLLDHRQEMTVACEALLFMASRALLTANVIRPALDAGRVVVADRYQLANVVYQGHAGGLGPEPVAAAGRLATDGLEPDLILVLDLPVETARARRQGPADRMESKGTDFQARVRAGFLAEARRRPERIRVIDASATADAVQERIWQEVSRVLETGPRA